MINILIADDHKIIRDGIRALIADIPDIFIQGEAESGEKAIELTDILHPDLIVMDIKMPGMSGIQATYQILKNHPNTKIMGLSMHDEENHVFNMLKAGASGFLLKSAGRDELITAIRTVSSGGTYYSQDISAKVIGSLIQGTDLEKSKEKSTKPLLTEREMEVLLLIVDELTNQEISEKLNISHRTVDTHRRNLMQKLEVKNTAGLVRYALVNGLIPLQD